MLLKKNKGSKRSLACEYMHVFDLDFTDEIIINITCFIFVSQNLSDLSF